MRLKINNIPNTAPATALGGVCCSSLLFSDIHGQKASANRLVVPSKRAPDMRSELSWFTGSVDVTPTSKHVFGGHDRVAQ